MIWEQHGAAQADHLAGYGGYLRTDKLYPHSQHRVGTNAAGCLMCHKYNATDINLGGHSFNMRDNGEFHTGGCNAQNCHNNAMDIDSVNSAQNSHSLRLNDLGGYLFTAGLVDSLGDSAITAKDTIVLVPVVDTGMIGAMYNYFFIKNDRSRGRHNWLYDSALIGNSIDYIDSVLTAK
jgi:hypothetical protein